MPQSEIKAVERAMGVLQGMGPWMLGERAGEGGQGVMEEGEIG